MQHLRHLKCVAGNPRDHETRTPCHPTDRTLLYHTRVKITPEETLGKYEKQVIRQKRENIHKLKERKEENKGKRQKNSQ